MKKVTFIILHFNNYEDTVKCVKSLLKIDYNNFNILIIDNGSSNDSGLQLNEFFLIENKVKVLINDENLGYARGNNVGYSYAKNQYKSEFIILLNNDTIIQQKDFIYKLIEIYKELPYGVLGPNIISLKDGSFQNPQRENGITINELNKHIVHLRFTKFCMDIIYYTGIYKYLKILRNIIFLRRNEEQKIVINQNNSQERKLNFQLHGACLIFSPVYIQKFENALSPETFLYMEEDILYHQCLIENILMVYDPTITVLHTEDAATESLFQTSLQKHRFIYKHAIASSKILKNILLNSKN